MQQFPNPYDGRYQADPGRPPAARWRVPRAAAGAGLAALLAMAGAGAAFALSASGSSSHSSSAQALSSSGSSNSSSGSSGGPATAKPPARHGPRGRFGPGWEGFGPGMGPVVHGVYTVKNGTGFKTIEVQTGTVTSVSTSSISVTSADGQPETYTVAPSTVVDAQRGGISSVQKNDQVRIQAVKQSNGTFTATDIVDLTQIGSSRKGFGLAPPAPNFPAPNPPAPASPAS